MTAVRTFATSSAEQAGKKIAASLMSSVDSSLASA
jgi:hypothetical protein